MCVCGQFTGSCGMCFLLKHQSDDSVSVSLQLCCDIAHTLGLDTPKFRIQNSSRLGLQVPICWKLVEAGRRSLGLGCTVQWNSVWAKVLACTPDNSFCTAQKKNIKKWSDQSIRILNPQGSGFTIIFNIYRLIQLLWKFWTWIVDYLDGTKNVRTVQYISLQAWG